MTDRLAPNHRNLSGFKNDIDQYSDGQDFVGSDAELNLGLLIDDGVEWTRKNTPGAGGNRVSG